MKRKDTFASWGIFFLFLAILSLLVALLMLLLSGDTSINNSNGNNENTKSLTCERNDAEYPFLSKITGRGTIKINGIFNEKTLEVISLVYKVHYDDEAQIERSETNSRIAMNESFSKDNLGSGALGAVFAKLKDAMQFSLQANANEINGMTAKYFLLDGLNGVHNREAVAKHYNEKGFDCLMNN